MSVLYIRDPATGSFVPIKTIKGEKGDTGSVENMPFDTQKPAALGTAATGTSEMVSRGDHVHPLPSASDVGALPATGTAANAAKVENKTVAELLLAIYPVGSIYMSVSDVSPASLFGGTWESIKDTFLLSAGDSYAAGATGGVARTTLTTAQLPSIAGTFGFYQATGSAGGIVARASGVFSRYGDSYPDSLARPVANSYDGATSYNNITMSLGDGESHENMPPYLAVYVWKRVA